MTDDKRLSAFLEKYKNGAKVWSGHTFTGYLNLRPLLEELPIADAAAPSRDYPRQFVGIADNVYGEIIHNLLAYEGYLRDKAYPIRECLIKPLIDESGCKYQFVIRYVTKEGEERQRTYEVVRRDERNFIFYADPLQS
jgi:hypothetical protein